MPKDTDKSKQSTIHDVIVSCNICENKWVDTTEFMIDNRVRTIITDGCHICQPKKIPHKEIELLDCRGNLL